MVIGAPTGWGKTIVAAHVIRRNLERRKRTTFVVDSLGLVEQTVHRLYEEGITDVGVIQGEHEMHNLARPVQVASVQTLSRRGLFPHSDLVIIDECHMGYRHIKEWLRKDTNGTLFVGLTATPYREGMGDEYETLIPTLTTQEAIAKGILCPPRVFSCGHPDLRKRLKKVKVVAGEYVTNQLSETMQDKELTGNVVTTWLERWGKGKTLVFGVDRMHAQSLMRRFEGAGARCGYQDGDTPEHSGVNRFSGEFEVGRDELRAKFHDGEIDIICSVGTMTKGIDWDVRCISLARPTKSPTLFKQIIGRGLRSAPGKNCCVVFDHGLCTQELGFVTEIECEELHRTKDGKGRDTKPKKFVIKYAKECPQCHAFREPGKRACEGCGFEPTSQTPWIETDAELQEVDRQTLPKKATRQFSMAQKMVFLAELKSYAAMKGYQRGWAAQKYRSKFAVWPDNSIAECAPRQPSVETLSWIKAEQIRWSKSKANPKNQAAANV